MSSPPPPGMDDTVVDMDKAWSHHTKMFLGVRFSHFETSVVFTLALAGLVVPLLAYNIMDTQFLDLITHDMAVGHALVPLLQLLPEWISVHVAMNYVSHHALHNFTGDLTKGKVSVMRMHLTCPGKPVLLIMFLLFVRALKQSATHTIKEPTLQTLVGVANMLMAFVLVFAALSGLDSIHDQAWHWARRDGDQVLDNPNVKKWRSIGHGFAQWGNAEKDKVYSFAETGHHMSPAFVLADVVSVYILGIKVVCGLMYILFLAGIDLYQNLVPLMLISGFGALLGALQLQSSFSALLALAVSRPFYVGEIIGLSKPGAGPADVPTKFVVGFVEAITFFHVVMRDFKKKQVFIPLAEFAGLTLHNWTRRSAHLCYWMLTVSSGDKDGLKISTLACFVRSWIKAHELIDHTGYTKAVVKGSVGTGLKMEVVFYPAVGKNVYQLRAEFVVTLMDAATRLGLTLIPEDLVTPYPETLSGKPGDMAPGGIKLGDVSLPGKIQLGEDLGKPLLSDSASLEDLLPSRPGLAQKAGFA